MSNLTVGRFDKDVQNIMSRIEEQLPPRLNACTVYPDPDCSFGVTRDVTATHDACGGCGFHMYILVQYLTCSYTFCNSWGGTVAKNIAKSFFVFYGSLNLF
uniref:Uncharacterized protein n=1 Tax=Ditylenchus dipsaci TaxID=166011 RepID=A0A915EQT7_9BILA